MRVLLKALLSTTLLFGCGENAVETAVNGGPTKDTATKIEFGSDVSWLQAVVGKLDQASLPWVMGSFLLSQDVEGVSVPVLFDADADPGVTVDIKIEVAGSKTLDSTAANGRAKLKIYEKTGVALKPLKITAVLSSGDSSESYDRIPEAVPFVGGKTIVPLYFMIPMTEFDWSTAGESTKTNFKNAFDNGSLGDLMGSAGKDTPLPWTDCETVKITITYNKDESTGQDPKTITHEKYLASDPKATLQLIGALADAGGPLIKEQTGFDISSIKTALEGTTTATCEPVTDAQKALFAE